MDEESFFDLTDQRWEGVLESAEHEEAGECYIAAASPTSGGMLLMMVLIIMGVALLLYKAADLFMPSMAVSSEGGYVVTSAQPVEVPSVDEQKEPPESSAQVEECKVSPLFPSKVTRWCPLITYYAERNGLNPDLVAALIWLESGGNPQAYSASGAVGLMQIMPRDGVAASFQCVNGPCFQDRPSREQLFDPEFNIAYGTRMLARLLKRHGSLREALRAYGPMNYGYTYADKVLSLYRRYRTTQ